MNEQSPPERPDSDAVGEPPSGWPTIVRAAERAAASVIDNAEEQAQRRIDEAQERADRIVAERLRAIADELDPPAPGGSRSGRGCGPWRRRRSRPSPRSRPRAAPGEAGARLLATQMAVSGASRKEIENRLRNGAGIEDPAPLLDAILGPEGVADARRPDPGDGTATRRNGGTVAGRTATCGCSSPG